MPPAFEAPRVRAVLERLRDLGEEYDGEYGVRVRAHAAELGQLSGRERAVLGARAPLAIAPEVGRILYGLILAVRPRLVVEFGGSLGVSTIFLAAALHDLGSGALVTTELVDEKATALAGNLAAAGLLDRVEVRPGDARDTLTELPRPVDLLFLDGANDLYLEILGVLEPRLSPHAVIVADLSHGDPDHVRYREDVSARGYLNVEIPVDAGLLISTPSVPYGGSG